MEIRDLSRTEFCEYISRQLESLFPDGRSGSHVAIERHIDEALERVGRCINGVRVWRANEFDYLHSSQYAIFLYYLSNSMWRAGVDERLCTKVFLLNKALNGIDCFYELELPEVFFIGHSVGIVLAKATYGEYLVLYQNSTVGKNHGMAPVLGERVVMYPNTAVIGRSHVADGSVIGQGVSVINRDTPGECFVFSGVDGTLEFKPPTRDVTADLFRFPDGT